MNAGRFGDPCPIEGCTGHLNHRDGASLVCSLRKHWVIELGADA